jgi:carbon monoxide dehydrogenase subunit G
MGSATNEIDIDRSADQVWDVVRDYGGLGGWMPGIDSCRMEGNDRILEMMGMELTETLVRSDDQNRTLVYSITKSPMPLEHHEATIAVSSTGDASSHVTYSVEVRPDAMVDAMSSAYAGALRALKSRVEGG